MVDEVCHDIWRIFRFYPIFLEEDENDFLKDGFYLFAETFPQRWKTCWLYTCTIKSNKSISR